MSNTIKWRVLGIAYGGILIGSASWSHFSFFTVLFLFQLLCLREFYLLATKNQTLPNKYFGILSGSLIFVSSALHLSSVVNSYVYIVPAFLLCRVFLESLYFKPVKSVIDIGYVILGILYLSLPFACLNYIAFFPTKTYSPEIVIGYLALLWAYDVGSGVIGLLIGKHKIFRKTPSNKTWEGLAGGAILCIGLSYLISLLVIELNLAQWLIIAIITITTVTYSHFGKIFLRRSVGSQDLSHALPEQGGLLNRLDSILFSTPIIYIYLMLV